MKIFVVGPETGDCFTHNVAYTFRKMGHEVVSQPQPMLVLERSVLGRGLLQLFTKVGQSWRIQRDRTAIKIAQVVKPHLTVVCTGTLEPDTIAAIRNETNGLVVCWYGDSPANLKRGHLVSGEYDAIFMKDKEFVERLTNNLGLTAYHLEEACNPDWHKPVTHRSGNTIVMAGTMYGYRNTLVDKLSKAGYEVRVYGPSPSFWVPTQIAKLHSGIYLDHTNKATIFGKAMACLNNFAPAEGDSLNCRIFETCGSGGLLLTERHPVIERCFEPETEYLAFSSFAECLSHLERLQKDYTVANKIREHAAKHAHAEHTYQHRLTLLLKTIGMS